MKGPLLPSTLKALVGDCVQRIFAHCPVSPSLSSATAADGAALGSQHQHFATRPVGLLLHNTPHSVALLIASQQLNLHTVLLSPSRRSELEPLARTHTGITGVLENTAAALNFHGFDETTGRTTANDFTRDLGGQGSACLFTSGSTDDPKIVVYTWAALLRQAKETLRRTPFLIKKPLQEDSLPPPQLVAVSSIAHAYAINAVFTCHLGSVPLGLPASTAEEARQYLLETAELPIAILGTPAFYDSLLQATRDEDDLSNIKLPYSAGCALSMETWRGFKDRFGLRIMQNFGTSETGNVAVYDRPSDEPRQPGYVGIPWGEIRFRDPVTLRVNEDASRGGEVMVSVPWKSEGYVANRVLHRHDEFYPTGDFGRLTTPSGVNEDGRGLIVSHRIRTPLRVTDQASQKTFVFEPVKAELMMMRGHPGVKECVAVQSDDGASFGMLVVLRSPTTAVTPTELTQWWDANRQEHHLPPLTRLRILPSFPKSAAGKLIYKQITWSLL